MPLYGVGLIQPDVATQQNDDAQRYQVALGLGMPVPLQAIASVRPWNDVGSVVPAVSSTISGVVRSVFSGVGEEMAHVVLDASKSFESHWARGEWADARSVLETLGMRLATVRDAEQGKGSVGGGLSEMQSSAVNALKVLKTLDLVTRAFLMGSWHYCDGEGHYVEKWKLETRCQLRAPVSMACVVEFYMDRLKEGKSRAKVIQAILVHLSWLAPPWKKSTIGADAHARLLSDALKLLSDKLKGAHDQLTSERARMALRQDVLAAVAPAYCSPLLVDRLAALPGFRLDPAAMDAAVRDVKAGQGFKLFPGGDGVDGVDAIGVVAHSHSKAGGVSDGSAGGEPVRKKRKRGGNPESRDLEPSRPPKRAHIESRPAETVERLEPFEPLQPHTLAQLAMLQRPQGDGPVHTTTTVPAQALVPPPPPAETTQSAATEVPIDFVRLFFGDV